MTPNIEQARHNMINNQVRTWDVLDTRVLDTLAAMRREDFVPATFRNMAFTDMAIPLGHGEVMMKPVVEGRLLQALDLKPTDKVLEIGTGSGYLAACMARMASHVTSVDLHEDFVSAAQTTLTTAGINNVSLHTGEAVKSWKPDGNFNVVVVSGALPAVDERFLSWLKPGGRAFMICGHSPVMRAMLVHREGHGAFRQESLFETDLPWLVHASPAPEFTL